MHSDPGWYLKNTDPAQIFSAKEEKTLVIDSKRDETAFRDFSLSMSGSKTTKSSIYPVNELTLSGGNFEDMGGRNVTVVQPAIVVAKPLRVEIDALFKVSGGIGYTVSEVVDLIGGTGAQRAIPASSHPAGGHRDLRSATGSDKGGLTPAKKRAINSA